MSNQNIEPSDLGFESTYEEESFGSGLIHGIKNKPFVATGIVGLSGALVYGYRRYKTKGYLVSPSLFLMQLRVGAQAAVVGCITVGMLYNMFNQHVLKKKDHELKL